MEESRIPEILEVMKKQGIGLTMMNAEFTLFPRGGDENIRREEHDPAEKDENKRRDLLMRTQYGRNAQPDERVRYLTGKVITREKGEPIAPPELETRKASTYRSYNSANLTVHDTDFVPLNDKPLKPERPVTPRTKTRGYTHISL
jgi:MoaA/NifB/PqqE/SkfB family radical SAM enzyme